MANNRTANSLVPSGTCIIYGNAALKTRKHLCHNPDITITKIYDEVQDVSSHITRLDYLILIILAQPQVLVLGVVCSTRTHPEDDVVAEHQVLVAAADFCTLIAIVVHRGPGTAEEPQHTLITTNPLTSTGAAGG